MDLITDTNILFFILIKSGKTEDLLFENKLNLFAPEFIFEEFKKYENLILQKSERNKEDFDYLLSLLKKKIRTIPNKETEEYIEEASTLSHDIKDIDYFALALKFNCPIWSNDKELKKQRRIIIYSTEDLIKLTQT